LKEISKSKTVMIGDNMDTDIEFGAKLGINTCLVLSGVSKEQDINEIKPSYILDKLSF
jgi:ribonucleotide monophosphatase NagD (HAD superfamily)